jgi:hypothetical protein
VSFYVFQNKQQSFSDSIKPIEFQRVIIALTKFVLDMFNLYKYSYDEKFIESSKVTLGRRYKFKDISQTLLILLIVLIIITGIILIKLWNLKRSK